MARVPLLTRSASSTRVAELRAQGFYVQRVTMPNGDVVVLKSRRPIRAGHHSPFAVIYGGSTLHSPPNPFRNDVALSAELQARGGRLWDTGFAELDEAIQEAHSAGNRHEGRIVVYDESTGKPVHVERSTRSLPTMAKRVILQKRLPRFELRERWELRQPDGSRSWIVIAVYDSANRHSTNDLGASWIESNAESDARRAKLRRDGWAIVEGR